LPTLRLGLFCDFGEVILSQGRSFVSFFFRVAPTGPFATGFRPQNRPVIKQAKAFNPA